MSETRDPWSRIEGRRDPAESAVEPGFDEGSEPRTGKSARRKLMDLLARRDYSELEVRQKLAATHAEDDVDDAIAFAKEKGWMLPLEELAERAAAALARKHKGHEYIAKYLEAKGLPAVSKDPDDEIRKGVELARTKLDKAAGFDYEEQSKVARLLANRGFDDETVERVIDELKRP